MSYDKALDPERQATFYALMREVHETATRHWAAASRLYPAAGTVGIGGADFDEQLKAVVCDEFLSGLRDGMTPTYAYEMALDAGRVAVSQWNNRGSKTRATFTGAHELKRWEDAGSSIALSLLHKFTRNGFK